MGSGGSNRPAQVRAHEAACTRITLFTGRALERGGWPDLEDDPLRVVDEVFWEASRAMYPLFDGEGRAEFGDAMAYIINNAPSNLLWMTKLQALYKLLSEDHDKMRRRPCS